MCYLPSFLQWGRGLSTVLVVQVWRETECASQLVNDRAGNTVPSFLFFFNSMALLFKLSSLGRS